MIRINLLPIKHDRRREAGRNQLLIGLACLAVEALILFLYNLGIEGEVDQQANKNSIVQSDVNRIENQIRDHSAILKEINDYEKRQGAIDALHAARTGPVYVMLELSNLLSRGGRPHIDNERYQQLLRVDPAAGYDENWDYRRLWLESFEEKKRQITIRGQAITHEDVAEFLRRVTLSQFFTDMELVFTDLSGPKLPKGSKEISIKETDPVVHFELKSVVHYK